MIFSMSDKWRESSIFTKIATGAMALCFVFTLICDIIMMSWGLAVGGLVIFYLIILFIIFLLTLGLYKVNRFTRRMVILASIGIALFLVFCIWYYTKVYGMANSMTGGLSGILISLVSSLIPDQAKAVLGLFILAYVMVPISGVTLIIGGRDFKKEGRA